MFKTTYGLAPDDLTQVVEHIRSRQHDVEGLYVMKVETMDEDALRGAIINRLKAQQVPGDLLPGPRPTRSGIRKPVTTVRTP